VRHQDQVSAPLAHDPQGCGELIVGVDPDPYPPGRGIDHVCGAAAPEDAGLGVGLVGAPGDLPVGAGQGEHVEEVSAVGLAQPPGGRGQPPVGAAARGLGRLPDCPVRHIAAAEQFRQDNNRGPLGGGLLHEPGRMVQIGLDLPGQ
jgi:hypothetical protein